MNNLYNIYCDESCHLEFDNQKAMVLGAIWCPKDKVRGMCKHIREIKARFGLSNTFETKWIKVSPAMVDFYLTLVNYFFENDDLHFRALIVPDKSKLNHRAFRQTHDLWYYKMYFDMLKAILHPQNNYRIYIDIKDTQGSEKLKKLQDILSNNLYDYSRSIIERIQAVHSHEIEILQLTDLLIGAISYVNRELTSSEAKLKIIENIKERSGYSLVHSTLYLENKFNIFKWSPGEVEYE